eukprot:11580456-Karenia_brevis.AAC.1
MRARRGYRVFLGHPMRGTPIVPWKSAGDRRRRPNSRSSMEKQCFSSPEFAAAFPGESDTQAEEAANTLFFWSILCEEAADT